MRRSEYDVTDRIRTTDTAAVEAEVLALYLSQYPRASPRPDSQVMLHPWDCGEPLVDDVIPAVHIKNAALLRHFLARPAGFEPTTLGFGGQYSIL